MYAGMSTTTYLDAYQPYPFSLTSVDLDIELFEEHALVHAQMHFTRIHPGPLCLNGDLDAFTLLEVWQNGTRLAQPELHQGQLTLDGCPDQVSLRVTTRLRPQDNTHLSGLYRSNHLFCTQCEAEGFRRITLFPDRPDVLTRYTTRISADKTRCPVLLSNGELTAKGETPDGRHWALWTDPFPKPCYLFAMVAGDLACVRDTFVTRSGKHVDLEIYVEPQNIDQCAHALISLKKAMRWDEDVYGREYDLNVYMIVAVSDFNMGAMENKGLNVFNAKYVLARPNTATDQDYAGIESVIAHEYFHNWTGNRVTCRDWFQLSLKEGLTVFRDQEFSRDMNSRDVNRIKDVNVLRQSQFPEDAGCMAHPVRPRAYEEINNFYTATIYNKGAEVIRMQHTLLGADGFRRGMDQYFERHDGHAVTIDDFVQAMEDANNVDLTQFKRWYDQAGTPHVDVQSRYEHGTLTLHLRQTCPPTPETQLKKPFHIPLRLALWSEQGQRLPTPSPLIELREAEQTFVFDDLPERPVVSLLRDFSAPITLSHPLSEDDRLTLLRVETDGFSQWDNAQQLARTCIIKGMHDSRVMPSSAFMHALQAVLNDETRDPALRALLLTPPGFETMATALTDLDVTHLENSRDRFHACVSHALFADAQRHYDTLWGLEDHSMHGQAYGRRALRNTCLRLMMQAQETIATSHCQNQMRITHTMTDQMAALTLLANHTDPAVQNEALAWFYTQWGQEPLLIDKWLFVQATRTQSNPLTDVQRLLSHPAFHLNNPNNVRSLIGAFTQQNPRYFHAEDGQGYAFLTEMLLKIDAINPQIAARLSSPFTQWKRLNQPRQQQIQQQLRYLAGCKISKDLNEVVSKSCEA